MCQKINNRQTEGQTDKHACARTQTDTRPLARSAEPVTLSHADETKQHQNSVQSSLCFSQTEHLDFHELSRFKSALSFTRHFNKIGLASHSAIR